MRSNILFVFSFLSIAVYSQTGRTFTVEKLSKPETYLSTKSDKDIFEGLILSNINVNHNDVKMDEFPFNNSGNRNNLKTLSSSKNLPEEIVKVDLNYIDSKTGITTPLELWAGFIGLEQNIKNYELTPKIGWIIRKKDVEQFGLQQKYENDLKTKGGIAIRVKEIPEVIFGFTEIKNLEIQFIDNVIIPDRLANIKIQKLVIEGKIDKSERKRIRQLFPNTEIIIDSSDFDVSIKTVTMDAQQPNILIVKGKVIEEDTNVPIPGVTVIAKDTTTGTVTDVNGNFSIKIEQGKTLVFSFIGYNTHEMSVCKEMIDE